MQTKVDQTYIDDPLRILRNVRFAVRYGFTISPETYSAMKRNVKRLKIITKERIQTELNKILCTKNGAKGINILHEIGAMKFVVPEFDKCYDLKQNAFHFGDVAEHTLAVLDHHCQMYEPNLVERLACFLHDIGKTETQSVKDGKIHFYDHEYVGAKMCEDILRDLKYDNDTIKEVSFLIRNHMRTKQTGDGCSLIKDKTLNKLLYECKTRDRFVSLMKIIDCDNLSHKKEHCIYDQFTKLVEKVDNVGNYKNMFGYKLPVSGNDIMEVLNISPGPVIAEINKRLLNQVFRNPDITREECVKLLPGIKKEAENYLKK